MSKRSEHLKKLLRPGDVAKVVNPLRVYRCGYELNPTIAGDKIAEEHPEAIAEFFKAIGIEGAFHNSSLKWDPVTKTSEKIKYGELCTDHHVVKRFLGGVGYLYTNAKSFGGRDRKLFKDEVDNLTADMYVRVNDTKHVMTGEYFAPSGGYDSNPEYGYEYYYEPGGLANQKCNRLVQVSRFAEKEQYGGTDFYNPEFMGTWNYIFVAPDPHPHQDKSLNGLWMDSADLEKVMPDAE